MKIIYKPFGESVIKLNNFRFSLDLLDIVAQKGVFRMTKFICETKNLSKKYKDFYALKNVNLTIPKGEIYGLVGEMGQEKRL